jgi:hypothetical protein
MFRLVLDVSGGPFPTSSPNKPLSAVLVSTVLITFIVYWEFKL